MLVWTFFLEMTRDIWEPRTDDSKRQIIAPGGRYS